MLKDLRVDINKNTKIDKAVLEVRIDASAGRGIAVRQGAGGSRHSATPTSWVQKLTEDGKVKITKILEPRNWQISESNSLVLERCHCHFREGRSGIALRAGVQEITRSHPDVFTFDDARELYTQSETDVEFGQ